MRERWTKEQAWAWYDQRPWVMGVNYVPSITVLGRELWQEDTYEEVIQSVRKEFALMQDVGLNGVRIFLPFNVWYYERDAFLDRLDAFLGELDAQGITMMPVIFNDCVDFGKPEDITPELPRGWQPYDIGHHGARKENPFTGDRESKGWIHWDEPEWRPVLEEYLCAVIGRFRNDPRIYAWDLWNEPGNSNRFEMSIPFMKRAFELARSLDPIQPLTACVWRYPEGYGADPTVQLDAIQQVALEESDIVTFHHYGRIQNVENTVRELQKEGRPMMNTEWLNRIYDNLIQNNLPLYHRERIGSYSWGLVAGKSQHFLPWDVLWTKPHLPLRRWQHDLFDTFHTPYDPEELELMRKLSPKQK